MNQLSVNGNGFADLIRKADRRLALHFSPKLKVNPHLTRALVSFQANKKEPGFRWFKFKEGFSAALVDYMFDTLGVRTGRVIDPFAGSGATLFTSSRRGLDSLGIELLPIGCEVIKARLAATEKQRETIHLLGKWLESKPWRTGGAVRVKYPHLRITEGAFPSKSEHLLESYIGALNSIKDNDIRSVLRLAALSTLEEISFTRKDGQYLRWDYRSGRRPGAKKFDKGPIKDFDSAICTKLSQFKSDLENKRSLFDDTLDNQKQPGRIELINGSCLEELPSLATNSFDALMTSPPYCNRYDYTRTYALELAFLGVDEASIRALRQNMLSCTVESREKTSLGDLFGGGKLQRAQELFNAQELLAKIYGHLTVLKDAGQLNNSGIPRMVRNYFWEITLVLLECARILKPGAPFIMVNDNVQYAGIPIPVDLILSSIAEGFGFEVEAIWVLPNGKGNSSQQMGEHGREELRKCVYVWRAPKAKQAKLQVPQLAHSH